MKFLRVLGILVLYTILQTASEKVFGKDNVLFIVILGIPFIFWILFTLANDEKK